MQPVYYVWQIATRAMCSPLHTEVRTVQAVFKRIIVAVKFERKPWNKTYELRASFRNE